MGATGAAGTLVQTRQRSVGLHGPGDLRLDVEPLANGGDGRGNGLTTTGREGRLGLRDQLSALVLN